MAPGDGNRGPRVPILLGLTIGGFAVFVGAQFYNPHQQRDEAVREKAAAQKDLDDGHHATQAGETRIAKLALEETSSATRETQEEALRDARVALEQRRSVLGSDHKSTIGSIVQVSIDLLALGQTVEANELGAEALERARRTLPDGHVLLAICVHNGGKTLAALGRFSEAEPNLLQGHRMLSALGQERATTTTTRFMVTFYEVWHTAEPGHGYNAKAAEWRTKLEALEAQAAKP